MLVAWILWKLFPTEEEIIRKRLERLATLASLRPNQSTFARLLQSNNLREFFTPDVVARLEIERRQTEVVNGRATMMELIRLTRSSLKEAKIRVLDITVKVSPEKEAATARMTVLADIDGERNSVSQEIEVDLNKSEGLWRIAKLETIRTLQ